MRARRVFILAEIEGGESVLHEIVPLKHEYEHRHDVVEQRSVGAISPMYEHVRSSTEGKLTYRDMPTAIHVTADSLLDCVQKYVVEDAARRLDAGKER